MTADNASLTRQAFVPPRYYAALIDTLCELGHDRAALMAVAGLDAKLLASEAGHLTLAQVDALVSHACSLENTDDLGLRVGQRLQLMSHGALSVAAVTAPTARAALAVVVEFFPLIMPLFSLEVHELGAKTAIRLVVRYPLNPEVERFHTATMSGSVYAQLSFLLGGPVPDGVEVHARHPRPPGLPAWVDEVGITLIFDEPQYELRLPSKMLDIVTPLADPRTHELGRQRCLEALKSMPDPSRLSSTVARLLHESGPPFPSLDATSRSLSLSSRSLRRRLKEEGTSFREILEDVRLSLADNWLGDPARTITDIGISLGYADASNFSRAYRRSRGTSAKQARAALFGENSEPAGVAATKSGSRKPE